MDEIKEQTDELAAQLKKLESVPEGDDAQYINELEKFNWDLKKADFCPEAQAAGITSDKVLFPPINGITK